jgi:PAS domain S-box-containing protein
MTIPLKIGYLDLECIRSLIENTSDTIFIIDSEGIISYLSPSARHLLGMDSGSAFGTEFRKWIHPEDLASANETFLRALSGETIRSLSVRMVGRSGGMRHCEISGVPLARDGKIGAVSGVLRDVSEAHAVEKSLVTVNAELMDALEQLSQAQEGLVRKERDRAFSEIAGGVVHDFNNVLTLISGHTELLLDQENSDGEQIEGSLGVIEKAALNGQHIVRRLRGLYAQDASVESVERVEVNSIIKELCSLTRSRRHEDSIRNRGYIEFHSDLRPIGDITANRVDINGALLNILLNACDAMPDGGAVSVSTRQLGDSISVRISDTGHGMTSDQKKHCLDAFYTSKGAEGTGLGLSEAASIVKRFKGAIQIDSEVGLGTRFTLTFPGIAVAGKADEDTSRLSVLVHSDDNDIFNVINAYLRLDDHRVQRITADELASLRNSKADVVVRFSESISGNMESDANQVLMQPACPWSGHVTPACPCNTAAVILPLSLAQFREGLAVCSTSRSSCTNASKYIVSSADEA